MELGYNSLIFYYSCSCFFYYINHGNGTLSSRSIVSQIYLVSIFPGATSDCQGFLLFGLPMSRKNLRDSNVTAITPTAGSLAPTPLPTNNASSFAPLDAAEAKESV